MKLNKIILAAALSVGAVGLSQADTVYISGSTAARAQVFAAFTTPGVVFTAAPQITTWGSGSGNGATYMIFEGNISGIGATVVNCHWSGSEGGVSDVATGASEQFVTPANYNHADNPTIDPSTNGATALQPVDLAFADTPFSDAGVYGNNPGTVPADLDNDAPIGVVTFKWIRNNGVWTGNNLTSSQVRIALGGVCPQSVFTGNNADTKKIYVSGRTADSGTRANAFAESGYGQFSAPSQIKISAGGIMLTNSGTGTSVANFRGDYGYSSGGDLAATMGGNTTASADKGTAVNGSVTGFSVIAYLGFNDAAKALGTASSGNITPPFATELTYNGVPWSTNNVQNGTYTFWGTEHVMTKNSPSSSATAVFNNIVAGIAPTFDGKNVMKLTDMHATKDSAGSDIVHN